MTPSDIRRACVALSLRLRTGLDYFEGLTVEELNETAETLVNYLEEARRHGGKK